MRASVLLLTLILTLITLATTGSRPAAAADVVYVDQGWTQETRERWYGVTQGSRLLPFAWMRALESPDGAGKLIDPANMAKLGYPANPASADGLPIGFVVDQTAPDGVFRKICRFFGLSCGVTPESTPWLGLNCAACHTAQMTYRGKTFEVTGAPTLADFQKFTEQVLAAMKATRAEPGKWSRFVSAVGGNEAALAAEFDRQTAWYDRLEKKNGVAMRYGPGRLDAQGHILNKVSLIVGVDNQIPGLPSDAPASYPFIWNVPQQDFIQWNGIVQNKKPIVIRGQETDFGALGRNVGEVIGVFGEVDVRPATLKGYPSSLHVDNLINIERALHTLRSPRWPAEFPEINLELKAKGEAVYAKLKCGGCHAPLAFDDTKTKIEVKMDPIDTQGTDPWLACNTFLHRSKSGVMAGRKSATTPDMAIAAETDTRFMLENAVIGTILGRADEIASTLVGDVIYGGDRGLLAPKGAIPEGALLPGVTDPDARKRARACLTASSELLRYKARPLNGIWATAPYLHNGSVPTLYDLLLPSSMRVIQTGPLPDPNGGPYRPMEFAVGQREFDPKKVGYAAPEGPAPFTFKTRKDNGEPLVGNYNSGHDYGTNMLEDERLALVEYLKSL